MLPEWLTSPIRTLARTCNRITRPTPRAGALEGREATTHVMALVRDLVGTLFITIPMFATHGRVIILRAIEPSPECDCDYETNH